VGGVFVKDADSLLLGELERRGALFWSGKVTHPYPHCWRCSSPLIYMARDSWFAATSTLKDRMLEHNRTVGWHPPEVGEGRFGEWLENNVDWALSRDRYWGTPLPVWICSEDREHTEWVGSVAELRERAGSLPEDFDPHRPFIDEVSWRCSHCAGEMRRDPVVIDVWFDSGAMPYAQWHWPHENEEKFRKHFPADFICEGLDQTRGWFYSLMAIGTMLDLGPVYRNVIVNGLILDARGQKMSKSKGNTVDPWDAIREFGADPLRWYLITSSNPWVPKRYDPEGVGEAARRFFDSVLNSYRFFSLYAEVEDWEPSEADPSPDQRSLLDRWLLSRLHRTIEEVGRELDGYQLTRPYRLVAEFLNEDLSNWYVRRSRARFWGKTDAEDGRAAFRTLWEALVTAARLTAPVAPFFSDWVHRAMDSGGSVHLARFPVANAELLDDRLEEEMRAVRTLVSLGRAAREEIRIRVRQPLRTLHAVTPEGVTLRPDLLALLQDELNVKEVRFLRSAGELVRLVPRPNFRALGPKFQKRSEIAAQAIRELPQESLLALRRGESASIVVDSEGFPVETGWLEIVEEAAGALVVKSEEGFAVALDPALDDELRAEGMAREVVNRVQRLRKESGLEITDRIRLGVSGSPELAVALDRFRDFIAEETLALEVVSEMSEGRDGFEAHLEDEIDGAVVRFGLSRAR
jgi:isoleucyl-tRNA synthetase